MIIPCGAARRWDEVDTGTLLHLSHRIFDVMHMLSKAESARLDVMS